MSLCEHQKVVDKFAGVIIMQPLKKKSNALLGEWPNMCI